MPEENNYYIFTLGCKINQYESQSIREAWSRQGAREVSSPEEAQIILINSCAVTARAVQDLRKAVRRFHRINPQVKMVITGCAAQNSSQDLTELPGIQRIVPQSSKSLLVNWPQWQNDSPSSFIKGESRFGQTFYPDLSISDFPRARPVLKIQDGCSQGCTYCIVPLSRGPARSRRREDILQEAHRLVKAGFQELVISGINLAQYGKDYRTGEDFWDLLLWLDRELNDKWPEQVRLRLSSLDPGLLSEKGFSTLSGCRLLCPHLHLSVQSASPRVLKDMSRGHYSRSSIEQFLKRLEQIWPVFGLGADILVGFPGESSHDFYYTKDFLLDLPFSYAHIFTYSPRPGTKAASMENNVSSGKKRERSAILRQEMKNKREVFLQKLQHLKKVEVILEQSRPSLGICEYYTLCVFTHDLPDCKGARLTALPAGWDEQGLRVVCKESAAVNRL